LALGHKHAAVTEIYAEKDLETLHTIGPPPIPG